MKMKCEMEYSIVKWVGILVVMFIEFMDFKIEMKVIIWIELSNDIWNVIAMS